MTGMDRPSILIRDLDEARCAAETVATLGLPAALMSVRDGALTAGIGWFAAVMRSARRHAPHADLIAVLDCGDRPDLVQAAWRQGIDAAIYRGDEAVEAKLAGIADRAGRTLLRRRPRAFEFGERPDPAALAAWCRRQLK